MDIHKRIKAWLSLSTSDTRACGLAWYHDANVYAGELAEEFQIPLPCAAGVIAALSPACGWEVNKAQAREMLQVYAEGRPRRYFIGSTYPPQIRKAWAIRELAETVADYDVDGFIEAIRDALGTAAFKTWAFFDNILRPTVSQAVTIDRHILAALDCDRRYSVGVRYEEIAEAVRSVSRETGYAPHQVQAIVWTTYKHLQVSQSEELPLDGGSL
jgi:hypothetical protein